MSEQQPSPRTPSKGRKFLERKEEEDWLRRCLPVIVQPELDIKAGHPLQCIFYKFRRDSGEVTCELSVIFQGEATYSPPCCGYSSEMKPQVSQSMTFVYRTWNRFAYERTADINSFIYLGINFTDRRRPYESIWTCDASGGQQWARGDKLQWPGCVTIHNHFMAEVPMSEWAVWGGGEGSESGVEGDMDSVSVDKGTNFMNDVSATASSQSDDVKLPKVSSHSQATSGTKREELLYRLPASSTRPLVYLNTCNHMMNHFDANPLLTKYKWARYCVCRGGRGLAESYALRCIPQKPNLTSWIVCDPVVSLFNAKSPREKELAFFAQHHCELPLWPYDRLGEKQASLAPPPHSLGLSRSDSATTPFRAEDFPAPPNTPPMNRESGSDRIDGHGDRRDTNNDRGNFGGSNGESGGWRSGVDKLLGSFSRSGGIGQTQQYQSVATSDFEPAKPPSSSNTKQQAMSSGLNGDEEVSSLSSATSSEFLRQNLAEQPPSAAYKQAASAPQRGFKSLSRHI